MNSDKKYNKSNKIPITLLLLLCLGLVLSFIKPKNYSVWFLEAVPLIIGVIILVLTYKKFRFTNFVYILILIQSIIMLIGAHYTYGNERFFNWLKNTYGLRRNYYDRFGHLIQGLIPAFIIRELFIRKIKFKKGPLLSILVVCICLSISAFYEIIEWRIGLISKVPADAFLGLQGDKWDTQWDMLCALIGAAITVSIFPKVHDKFINKM